MGPSVVASILAVLPLVAVEARTEAKSFVWDIRESNGQRSYLLGSVHLGTADLYPLPAAMQRAIKSAQVLVLEARVDQLLQMMASVMARGMYRPPDSLKKHLSPAAQRAVGRGLRKRGLSLTQFSLFRPWMLAMTVQSLDLQRVGYQMKYGIEVQITHMTQGRVEIKELEGIDFQLELFSSWSPAVQEAFLLYTLAQGDRMLKEMKALMKAWKTGAAKRMHRLLTRSLRKTPQFRSLHRQLIDDRNLGMAKKTAKMLSESDKVHLIVVGAAHLVGPNGMVSLLASRGLKLTQL